MACSFNFRRPCGCWEPGEVGAVSGVRVEPECSPQLGQRGRPWEARGQLEGAGPCWDVQAVAAGSPSIHPLWPFGTATGTLATVKGRPPLHTHWLSPEQLSSVALRRVSEGSSFVPEAPPSSLSSVAADPGFWHLIHYFRWSLSLGADTGLQISSCGSGKDLSYQ